MNFTCCKNCYQRMMCLRFETCIKQNFYAQLNPKSIFFPSGTFFYSKKKKKRKEKKKRKNKKKTKNYLIDN